MPDNRSFVASIAARYGPRLRRFLSVRLRNAADVPDLAQEVFLRLLRVEGYESIRSPEAYLFTIASRVIHQHAVRRSSAPVSVDIAEVFSDNDQLLATGLEDATRVPSALVPGGLFVFRSYTRRPD
jgi:RNA polymerase sigma-70 factor (ECF subfamily)